MANPIPTQLSPGVNVSEIDLSQFVQPESLNAAGMVGIFNWGPVLQPTRVTSESNLAYFFGKPTLDQSDVNSQEDFFAASNFLRYANNLKVIRVLQATDSNAVSKDIGITAGLTSCTYRVIKNLEHFRQIGGFSGSDGIEPNAHFRARYPGNFGDSLKVVVYDGPTSGTDEAQSLTSSFTTSTSITDYNLWGGYSPSSVLGVTSGVIGFTFTAQGYYTPSGKSQKGSGSSGSFLVNLGTTGATLSFYMVTVELPPKVTPGSFISAIEEGNDYPYFVYATGTTSANWTLTESGSNPDGNRANYYVLEDASTKPGADGTRTPYNLWSNPGSATIFIKPSTLNATGAVDMLFLNGDRVNMCGDAEIGEVYPGASSPYENVLVEQYSGFTYNGVPSHFGSLIFQYDKNDTRFDDYRYSWSRPVHIDNKIFPLGAPGVGIKGWARLVGLTGNVTYQKTTNGITSAVGITFATASTVTGVRQDFAYGIRQFGRNFTTTNTTFSLVQFSNQDTSLFDKTPTTSEYASNLGGSNDELSVAVIDTLGKFGPKNGILERFELLSKAVDAKNLDGESIYYKDYINNNSQYVYLTKPFTLTGGGTPSSDATTTFGDIYFLYKTTAGVTQSRTGFYESEFDFGQAGQSTTSLAESAEAYSLFATDENAVDILFVPESSSSTDNAATTAAVEGMVYDNVIQPRKDTILIIPTPKPANISQHPSVTATRAVNYRNSYLFPSNSYTMLVAGRKTYFDTYNNQVRKMSLSSDLAGILAAQEVPWESPAGFARGNLRNVIRLETNFSKQDRDELYKNGVNFFLQSGDGSGTILFGDKTMLSKPSAFDRINVRRVFVAIEKAIAKASKYSLFEFNDEFTRSQFRNLVNPFLSTIQAQRGIADFKVVCDTTNNTAEVIDKNQFVADIYIKPLKSINFIQLNFIAVRTDFNLTTIE